MVFLIKFKLDIVTIFFGKIFKFFILLNCRSLLIEKSPTVLGFIARSKFTVSSKSSFAPPIILANTEEFMVTIPPLPPNSIFKLLIFPLFIISPLLIIFCRL